MQSGCTIYSQETGVVIELPTEVNGSKLYGWTAFSSATFNGGLQHFPTKGCGVINASVPASYDGINPQPCELIRNAIRKRDVNLMEDATIGMMTAAHMKTLRTSTRSSGKVIVDVVVTAGISNARAAGADADCFLLQSDDGESDGYPSPGTINTIVVVNAPLTECALVEAYTIAVEAKCAACADLSIVCAKSGKVAQGTGTDCMVLLCPSIKDNDATEVDSKSIAIKYSGKHMLLGEFIGQAVKEATREAIICNINQLYGSTWRYHFYQCMRCIKNLVLCGAQPCVPPFPMMPVPSAPTEVLLLGFTFIISAYCITGSVLPRKATVLLAAAAWDRCLPSVPLVIHPVVLAGRAISFVTKELIPKNVYETPVLGLLTGSILLMGMLASFGIGGEIMLYATQQFAALVSSAFCNNVGDCHKSRHIIATFCDFFPWLFEVALVETTFSLQLLCTIALQMAKFLERDQIEAARNQLSWLCSRDPSSLNKQELAGATLESLSENLSDGTISPWFWYVLLGPQGALMYRIANTLDSRVEYRGGKFEWFGKPSARFDDFINILPARITALFLCIAAHITNINNSSALNGMAAAWRDCSQCASPNAGWPMAAFAGILGVRLEKKGEYCLGKCLGLTRDPGPNDIRCGHKIAQVAGGLALIASLITMLIMRN